MKRKIIIIIVYVLTILFALKLGFNLIINKVLINNYNNGNYEEKYVKLLSFGNFPQGYIANYNYGNVLYKNGKYDKAIEKYEKALHYFIPKNKECKIRINYALAVCKTVQVDEKDQESINDAIETYEFAIEVLTEKGCANIDDSGGHSKDAEKLKEDIQKEIERLKLLNNSDKQDDKKDDKNDKDKKENEKAETIETKIQEIKTEALQKQKELEELYKNYDIIGFEKVERNW